MNLDESSQLCYVMLIGIINYFVLFSYGINSINLKMYVAVSFSVLKRLETTKEQSVGREK